MEGPTIILERSHAGYENDGYVNLTQSGVNPATIRGALSDAELAELGAVSPGHGSTDGTPALREAVAARYPAAAAENVLIAHGRSEANLLALMVLAERGDHIIFVAPSVIRIDGLARSLGVEITQVALRPEDGWQPDITALESAIRPRTKLITLRDPSNATGAKLTQSSRQALADLSDRTGVWLHVDEIGRAPRIDGDDAPSLYGMGKRIIVTGGMAQPFERPDPRMGWVIGPQALVADGQRLLDFTSIGASAVSQVMTEGVMCEPVKSSLFARSRHIRDTPSH